MTLELLVESPPTILLDDAVLEQAIPSALIMAFLNSGQAFAPPVHVSSLPKSRLGEGERQAIRPMRCAPLRLVIRQIPSITVGPMVSDEAVLDRVQKAIFAKASKKAQRCWSAAKGIQRALEEGFYVKPTVFVNVTNDMTTLPGRKSSVLFSA